MVFFEAISVIVGSFALAFAYFRYKGYRNRVQHSLHFELVGEEFEFNMSGETHSFKVANLDIGGGLRPSTWRTLLFIEFDLDEFPWNQKETEKAENAIEDLLLSFNLMAKKNPGPFTTSFFYSYNSPAMMVVFPGTSLFEIREFIRRLRLGIGDILEHYQEYDISMGDLSKYMQGHLEFAINQYEENQGEA